MFDEIFKFMTADFAKLAKFGFVKSGEVWKFETKILDGEFLLIVFVGQNGKVGTKVLDTATNEEYVLHLLQSSQGQFVGQVRSEVEAVLRKICNKCFSREVFVARQSKEILQFSEEKFGGKLEFLWESSPNVAVLRRADTKKWYAVMFVLQKSKLLAKANKIADMTVGANDKAIDKTFDKTVDKTVDKRDDNGGATDKKANKKKEKVPEENLTESQIEKQTESQTENEIVEIVDLHIQPQEAVKIVDNKTIFAGYHMNKKSWITICLDGSVPTQKILKLLQNSFSLAVK